MLDVPNFFWESEPTLYPLYNAVREYLEIKPRIQVLNERCRVFLDLAEILSDSIADNRTSRVSFPLLTHLTFSLTGCTRSNLDHYRPHPYLHRRYNLRGLPPLWSALGSRKESLFDFLWRHAFLSRFKSGYLLVSCAGCV